ncbi:NAD(P)/FAD-dependent oxidoreductase [Aquipuribacter sp. SD81]|uniref:NAD(P)/FAD-dependent oxidoreductase n=1 Tax=Aquipuribacter sp. SD81 TaxID=3127703 RepID=UPI00301A2712
MSTPLEPGGAAEVTGLLEAPLPETLPGPEGPVPHAADVDVLVVGAGPVGLYAAYYAGFRGLSVAVVDSLPEPGGQVTAMYPEKLIYDVAGFPAVRGRDLVAGLVEQAARHRPAYLLGCQARDLVDDPEDGVLVSLVDGRTVRARAVLVTAGMGEFTPKPLPAAEGFDGEGVVHFVPQPERLAGQDVVVVGGGDSAFDWALMLAPLASSVTLVHRREQFRAHAGTVAAVQTLGVPLLGGWEVSALRADVEGLLTSVEVTGCRPATSGQVREIPATTVVAALGFHADLGPLLHWGLDLDHRAVVVDSCMRSSRARVYAAGDVCTYPGKVKLIATGFGEAATAVNNLAVDLDPAAHVFPGHSSAV